MCSKKTILIGKFDFDIRYSEREVLKTFCVNNFDAKEILSDFDNVFLLVQINSDEVIKLIKGKNLFDISKVLGVSDEIAEHVISYLLNYVENNGFDLLSTELNFNKANFLNEDSIYKINGKIDLSEREKEVFDLIKNELSITEISKQLNISNTRAKAYIKIILTKLLIVLYPEILYIKCSDKIGR